MNMNCDCLLGVGAEADGDVVGFIFASFLPVHVRYL